MPPLTVKAWGVAEMLRLLTTRRMSDEEAILAGSRRAAAMKQSADCIAALGSWECPTGLVCGSTEVVLPKSLVAYCCEKGDAQFADANALERVKDWLGRGNLCEIRKSKSDLARVAVIAAVVDGSLSNTQAVDPACRAACTEALEAQSARLTCTSRRLHRVSNVAHIERAIPEMKLAVSAHLPTLPSHALTIALEELGNGQGLLRLAVRRRRSEGPAEALDAALAEAVTVASSVEEATRSRIEARRAIRIDHTLRQAALRRSGGPLLGEDHVRCARAEFEAWTNRMERHIKPTVGGRPGRFRSVRPGRLSVARQRNDNARSERARHRVYQSRKTAVCRRHDQFAKAGRNGLLATTTADDGV